MTGIPFRLWRADHQTTRPNKRKDGTIGRAKATYSLLNLQPIGDFVTGKYLDDIRNIPALVSGDAEEGEVVIEEAQGLVIGQDDVPRRVASQPREEPPSVEEKDDVEWTMNDVQVDMISVVGSNKQPAAWVFTTFDNEDIWCYNSAVFKGTPLVELINAPIGTILTLEKPLGVRLDVATNPFGAKYLTPGMLLIDPDQPVNFQTEFVEA